MSLLLSDTDAVEPADVVVITLSPCNIAAMLYLEISGFTTNSVIYTSN